MSNTDSHAWPYLAAAAYALAPIDEFETWVYASSDLQHVVGPEHYRELISFNFRKDHARHDLTSMVRGIFLERRPHGIERDVAVWLARSYLAGSTQLVTISRVLARLWSEEHEWVPSEFAYIDSELVDLPLPAQYDQWNPEALAAKLAESAPRLLEFERAARVVAQQMLDRLESNARGA
jgi:hypothetical protein